MKLVHLMANSAWAFTTDGMTLVQLKGAPMFYATTQEARDAASKLGLIVFSDGEVGLSEVASELVSAFGMGGTA